MRHITRDHPWQMSISIFMLVFSLFILNYYLYYPRYWSILVAISTVALHALIISLVKFFPPMRRLFLRVLIAPGQNLTGLNKIVYGLCVNTWPYTFMLMLDIASCVICFWLIMQ